MSHWIDSAKPGDRVVCTADGRLFPPLHQGDYYRIKRKYESDGKTYISLLGVCEGDEMPGWLPERFEPAELA
jgi:hypothetical protein